MIPKQSPLAMILILHYYEMDNHQGCTFKDVHSVIHISGILIAVCRSLINYASASVLRVNDSEAFLKSIK